MLAKFIGLAVSPLAVALGLLALTAIALLRRRQKLALNTLMLTLIWLLLWSSPVLSERFYAHMIASYAPVSIDNLPKTQAIVVLGGGLSAPRSLDDRPDLKGSADRVWLAADLYHAGKAPLLLLSGGVVDPLAIRSEAYAMHTLLTDFGVPAHAVLLEEESRNTRENAQYSYALARQHGLSQILLVTSALHMPRALLEFKHAGFDVVPAPTDFELRQMRDWRHYFPSVDALELNSRCVKELLGLVRVGFND